MNNHGWRDNVKWHSVCHCTNHITAQSNFEVDLWHILASTANIKLVSPYRSRTNDWSGARGLFINKKSKLSVLHLKFLKIVSSFQFPTWVTVRKLIQNSRWHIWHGIENWFSMPSFYFVANLLCNFSKNMTHKFPLNKATLAPKLLNASSHVAMHQQCLLFLHFWW